MEIHLRDYQEGALGALRKGRAAGDMAQLVVLPTGSGKTIVAAADIRDSLQNGGRALFMAHRDELIKQGVEKTLRVWPEADIGRVKGSEFNEVDKQVVVASVQTIHRTKRLQPILDAGPIDLFYVDEAHHAAAPTYQKVIKAVRRANPGVAVVGLTATPVRADATKLDSVFKTVTFQKSMLDLIEQGYLADIELRHVHIDVSLDGVPVRRGDLKSSVLRKALALPNVMEEMVDAWQTYASGKRTLAFTVDVQHAHQMCERFNERGIPARIVHASTPMDERREIFDSFQRGEFGVLLNCAIATEGYDDEAWYDPERGEHSPALECIAMFTATLSQSRYIQMVGRGTRPAPNKDKLLLLDFGYNSQRHHLVQLPHLFGLEKRPTGEAEEREEGDGHVKSILAAVREARQADVHEPPPRAGFHWSHSEHGFILKVAQDQGFLLIRKAHENENMWRVWMFKPDLPLDYDDLDEEERPPPWTYGYRRNCLTREPEEFDWAFGLAEDAMRNMLTARVQDGTMVKTPLHQRDARWHKLPPTARQLEVLKRVKQAPKTRGEAMDMINAQIIGRIIGGLEPATKRQLGFMRWKKIEIPKGCTKDRASRLIAAYKKAEAQEAAHEA
jgi:superfamily II DNA or RNA helicase